MTSHTESSVFRFGVISDIQYADHDDAKSYSGTPRFYRHSIQHIKDALAEFKDFKAEFVLQLGDFIDGKCKDECEVAMETVLEEISKAGVPVYHTLGNHDLYNFSHRQVVQQLILPSGGESPDIGYYSRIYRNIRLVCLDSYDVSVLGRSEDESAYITGLQYMAANSNPDQNSSEGLEEGAQQLVKYNGGVGRQQLAWLSQQLEAADSSQQRVVVFSEYYLLSDLYSKEQSYK